MEHARYRAMLGLLSVRVTDLVCERWAAATTLQGETLHRAVEARFPGSTTCKDAPVPVEQWDLALRIQVVLHDDAEPRASEDEARALQYVTASLADASRSSSAGEMTADEFDCHFRRLIAAAELLGVDRDRIAQLQHKLPNWAVPLAAGGAMGAVGAPIAMAIGADSSAVLAGSSSSSLVTAATQGAVGAPAMQPMGAAALSTSGAAAVGALFMGALVGGVAYGLHARSEAIARERVARPTYGSRPVFHQSRVRLLSIYYLKYVTVKGELGIPRCTEATPSALSGMFYIGYARNNMVWLRTAVSHKYLRNGLMQDPQLRFDGEAPSDFELFDLVCVGRDRYVLKSGRLGGRFVAVATGSDAMHCEGEMGQVQSMFEIVPV